jgi:hypothetical protein
VPSLVLPNPQGVIPVKPDAWVWLGDFAYMDDPLINCDLVPSYPECNCTADFMRRPPFGCFAGVAEHARLRVQLQVRSAWEPGRLAAAVLCMLLLTTLHSAQGIHASANSLRTIPHLHRLMRVCVLWPQRTSSSGDSPTAHTTANIVLCIDLQLGIREYQQFLSFMCPGYQSSGVFPPLGTDPAMCPRPIFGTYDDHDSGWNNGNAR